MMIVIFCDIQTIDLDTGYNQLKGQQTARHPSRHKNKPHLKSKTGAVAFSADQRAKQKEKDYISRSLSKSELRMIYSLCLLMESKNNFALLSVFYCFGKSYQYSRFLFFTAE